MTRGISAFVSVTWFLFGFLEITTNQTSNFYKVMQQHAEDMVVIIMGFIGNLFLLQQWKNFENTFRIDKSYHNEFGVLLFWDTVFSWNTQG